MNNLRVLIADDEAAARAALRTLDWQKHDCILVGEAEDGQQVLDLLAQTDVDVVLLDIGMPVMNGLELAPTIARLHPSVKVIFLTMYREFDYAVEAMRTGAVDYLIKDVADTESIFAALDRVRIRSKEGLAQEIAQEKLLREQMEHTCQEPLPCLHPIRMLCLTQREKTKEHCPMYNVAKVLHKMPGCTAFLPVRENRWLLFGKGGDTEVTAYLEKQWPQGFHVTVALEGCADVKAAISKVDPYVHQSFYHPDIRLLTDGEYTKDFSTETMVEFQSSIRSCFYDISHDTNVLNEWMVCCGRMHIAPTALKQALIRLIPGQSDASSFTTALWNAQTASEVATLVRSYFLKTRLAGAGRRIEIQQVEDYVRTHLNENLSMQMLSSHAGLSPNYLNHLFREEMHETLKSYVMRIRMETAADMLKNTDMRINEIALRIGFPTARYFSDAFSKYYGVAPKDYRKG